MADSESTVTIVNGEEFKALDELNRHIRAIEQYFIDTEEYSGYPMLPDFWPEVYSIYEKASSDAERRMMFTVIYTKLLEAYKYWTTDLDSLWTTFGMKKHNEQVNHIKILGADNVNLWNDTGRNWRHFPN